MICDECNNYKKDVESYYVDDKYKMLCIVDRDKLIQKGLKVMVA